jgi:peptidoglycan lytic transglycosylase G
MPLQLDATTRYATGNYTKALTDAQLSSSSPYNTRNHVGLPPTPINSPGLSALQAASHPAQTNYLYFFAKHCTDKTVFFTNFTAFQNAANADAAASCKK